MKELKLDQVSAQLVDEEGNKYNGELVARSEYHTEDHYNAEAAEHSVLSQLFDEMSLKCADAYYITDKKIDGKKLESRFGTYQADLNVILYRNHPQQKIKETKIEIAAPIKVRFDEKLEHLVDTEGKKYQGKRFRTVSASSDNDSTVHGANNLAVVKLLDLIGKINIQEYLSNAFGPVTGYEIISSNFHDTRQEYDTTPFTATVTAILYK